MPEAGAWAGLAFVLAVQAAFSFYLALFYWMLASLFPPPNPSTTEQWSDQQSFQTWQIMEEPLFWFGTLLWLVSIAASANLWTRLLDLPISGIRRPRPSGHR